MAPIFFISSKLNPKYDTPPISIKIGHGCPAGCPSCIFNKDNVNSIHYYSLGEISKNIEIINSKFDKNFMLLLGSVNILNHPNIFEILDLAVKTGRRIKIQLDMFLSDNQIKTLKKIDNKYTDIEIMIPKRVIDDKGNIIFDVLKSITFYNKVTKIKIFYDLFTNYTLNKQYINKVMKFKTVTSFNKYNCIIGNRFDIKFHDFSWKLNSTKCEVDNLDMKECLQLKQIELLDNKICILDNMEMLNNGDLFIHDNLCNIGDIRISNIFRDNSLIYEDFTKFLVYLNSLKGNMKKNCFTCIKTNYCYEK